MNLIIVGPCGIGKSTIARALTNYIGGKYLDFDKLRAADMKLRKSSISPFSVSKLNLFQSLPPILNNINVDFVLDLGGDTVFRKNVDNNNRLEQILWVKNKYNAKIVILIAEKDILFQRFCSSKNRSKNEFFEVWNNWSDFSEPFWRQCDDLLIDTSNLKTEDVVRHIEKWWALYKND